MTKKESTERVEPSGKMTALRLDPKIRYLADLAAKTSGESLTKYLEAALKESFKRVTLRVPPEPEPMYLGNSGTFEVAPIDAEQERIKNEAMTIANLADSLWSESEFGRIQSLSILANRWMSDEDKALLQYIHARKDLHIVSGVGYKLNRVKIESEWDFIKAAFAKSRKGGKA